MVLQLRHVRVEAAEQEAPVGLEPRDLGQVVRAVGLERLRVARAARVLDLEQLAGVVERPAVEGAGEGGAVVLLAPAEHGALVAAGVDQRVQLAVAVAGEHDRLAAHVHRQVVAVVRQLGLVGQVDPVALEDVPHLELEDVGVGERVAPAPVDPPRRIDVERGVDLRPELVDGAAERHVRSPPVAEGRPVAAPGEAVARPATRRSCRGRRRTRAGVAAPVDPVARAVRSAVEASAWRRAVAFALGERLGLHQGPDSGPDLGDPGTSGMTGSDAVSVDRTGRSYLTQVGPAENLGSFPGRAAVDGVSLGMTTDGRTSVQPVRRAPRAATAAVPLGGSDAR